jgi:hypothetical protein
MGKDGEKEDGWILRNERELDDIGREAYFSTDA